MGIAVKLLISICSRLDSVRISMHLHTQIITLTSFSLILILILAAIFSKVSPQTSPPYQTNLNNAKPLLLYNTTAHIANMVKYAFLVSLIPLFITLPDHLAIRTTRWSWLSIDTFSLHINFRLDIYAITFTSIALFITWSILEFSLYYMASDPYIENFCRLLAIFLLAMITIISSNNLFQIFIGWEGVGFLSFLLIGWWFTRAKANSSALQAIIYNRLGDIGILIAAALLLINSSSFSLDTLYISSQHQITTNTSLLLWAFLLAAAGKSAQFGLHPWLPAAMEGPTPVSALLHSSTMVVAGVFLLIRVSPLIASNPPLQQGALILGSITALFASSCATTQHDLKKIVAFSTTRQLGLMTFAIGLNLPLLAFFHMCTHGFFKAMLFLCSGSIIHNTSNEQDLRKMGGLSKMLPTTRACLTIGRLALFGTPFLAGFYSKDLILESASASFTGLLTLSFAILATGLTAAYRARIILALNVSTATQPISSFDEPSDLVNPLKRLASGTVIAGWALLPLLIGTGTPRPIPTTIKNLAVILTILILLLASVIIIGTNLLSYQSPHYFQPFWQLHINFWYFPEIFHFLSPLLSFNTRQLLVNRLMDRGWGEQLGAQGIGSVNQALRVSTQQTQSGLIKQYLATAAFSFAIILILILTVH